MIIYHFIDGNFLCSCSSCKKEISSSPPLYWEFRRFLFLVYEQYVNQHKLENPECSKGKLSPSIHFLFSYTELFACHHKNHITAVMANFRKAFSLWVKAHKSQRVTHRRVQVGRLVCSGPRGTPQGADGIGCGGKLHWETPPHTWCHFGKRNKVMQGRIQTPSGGMALAKLCQKTAFCTTE